MRHYSRVEWTEPNRTTTNKRQRQWMILLPFDQTLLRVFALMTRQIVPPPPPYANRLVGNQLERLQQQWNDRPTKTATLFLYRTQFEKRSCTGDSLSCRILLETFGSILSIFNFPKNLVFLLHLLLNIAIDFRSIHRNTNHHWNWTYSMWINKKETNKE